MKQIANFFEYKIDRIILSQEILEASRIPPVSFIGRRRPKYNFLSSSHSINFVIGVKSFNRRREEINKLLFAKRIKLQGNALGDSFGTTLITKDAQLVDVNVKDEAAKLNQELEELQ